MRWQIMANYLPCIRHTVICLGNLNSRDLTPIALSSMRAWMTAA